MFCTTGGRGINYDFKSQHKFKSQKDGEWDEQAYIKEGHTQKEDSCIKGGVSTCLQIMFIEK